MIGTGADLLGVLAGGFVLLTFSVRSLTALRSFAVVSNVLFISYALAAHLMPIVVLHGLLLPLNLFRLRQQMMRARPPAKVGRDAAVPGGRPTAPARRALRHHAVRARRSLRHPAPPAAPRERHPSMS